MKVIGKREWFKSPKRDREKKKQRDKVKKEQRFNGIKRQKESGIKGHWDIEKRVHRKTFANGWREKGPKGRGTEIEEKNGQRYKGTKRQRDNGSSNKEVQV